jgi:carboxypeptidase Taq
VSAEKKYLRLYKLQKEVALLKSISALLEWDEQTYMPPKASEYRAEQVAYMAGIIHQKRTHPIIGELIGELEALGQGETLAEPQNVNIREWRRDYDLAVKLPKKLVEEISRTTIQAQSVWREARMKKEFPLFHPFLQKILELKRQEADCLGHSGERYDSLLDQFEPGAKTETIAKTLSDLRVALVGILSQISGSSHLPDNSILRGEFPESEQSSLVKEIAKSIGYDFERGSLDVTTHPFCTSLGPSDVRITTRYNASFINSAIFGIIHETGHAIYEQNLLSEYYGSPMGEAVSLGIHESQSRMWENFVARSLAFWEYWYPQVQNYFKAFNKIKINDFYFAINEVKPSFIRVEADELTYNLHILLRFEIERVLLSGELPVADLPKVWNEKFSAYFGLDVPDDALGCLQDVHWSAGLIGYFPTYTLGNLNAGQFFAQAQCEFGDLYQLFRRGEFAPFKNWLSEKIHRQGRRYNSAKLMEAVTGKPLDAKFLIEYLKKKYGELYQVSFK